MTAQILDGRALAAALRARVAAQVARLAAEHAVVPGLAMIKVGTDPASAVYVRSKMLHTTQAGIRSDVRELPAATTQTALLGLIGALNADPAIHGILVQLPPGSTLGRSLPPSTRKRMLTGFTPSMSDAWSPACRR